MLLNARRREIRNDSKKSKAKVTDLFYLKWKWAEHIEKCWSLMYEKIFGRDDNLMCRTATAEWIDGKVVMVLVNWDFYVTYRPSTQPGSQSMTQRPGGGRHSVRGADGRRGPPTPRSRPCRPPLRIAGAGAAPREAEGCRTAPPCCGGGDGGGTRARPCTPQQIRK